MTAATPFRLAAMDAGQLKDLLALHEAALASMSHGLCMVDAQQRLVLFNKRFLEMFELSPEVARIGMPMAELIRHSGERGNYPVAQLDGHQAAPSGDDGARQAVPAAAPDVARPHLRDGLSPAAERRLGHAGRGRHRAPAPANTRCACSSSASTRRSRRCRTACARSMPTTASCCSTRASSTCTACRTTSSASASRCAT